MSVDWRVYVILDPDHIPEGVSPSWVAQKALEGGAGVIQLRWKNATARQVLKLGQSLRELTRAHDACFIINDRIDIAIALDADGVHLGPSDLPIDVARRIAPNLIIGASAKSLEMAKEAVALGVNYLGCGAIYEARAVKSDASAPRGPKWLKTITSEVSLPVVGIGGIGIANAAEVFAAGADGVAMMREIITAPDPSAVVKALRQVTPK